MLDEWKLPFPLDWSQCWHGMMLYPLVFLLIYCGKSGESDTGDLPGMREAVLGVNVEIPEQATGGQKHSIGEYVKLQKATPRPALLAISYPMDSSVFPPGIVPPRFTWSNPALKSSTWLIEFALDSISSIIVLTSSQGPPALRIDPDAIPESGKIPGTPPKTMETWTPSRSLWEILKTHTHERFCRVRITGFSAGPEVQVVRSGQLMFMTSADSVDAPLFYRDVPFMPALSDEKGAILPLDNFNMKYIQWRVRDISMQKSKVVLKDMPTCANCHTFSRNGEWLGMDIDGTQGDKGAYGIQRVSKTMTYNRENIVSWNYDFKEKKSIKSTFGFLSSISPDGQYVISTVEEELFVVGYMDASFLQVFYPTKGILAFYSRETGRVKSLPGADDRTYVHCSPTWTPDGKYIIFSRAEQKEPFTPNQKMPAAANDPEETQIQYDLYKIPFNGGQGGKAVPIKGASFNGMSNNFSKVSPDGKWIVWVQCRNGLLMRPDSKLWIMPVQGGEPRLMKCNTWRMNSWHSWSPNSRWLVFASKKNRVYTEMFLTHIDRDGISTPPVLIPNSTADNRAVNIPEFFDRDYRTLDTIKVPAISHFRHRLEAKRLIKKDSLHRALAVLMRALDEEKRDRLIRAELMAMIGEISKDPGKSISLLKESIKDDPKVSATWLMLGSQYMETGEEKKAIAALKKGIFLTPDNYLAMVQLAKVYLVSEDREVFSLDNAYFYAKKANDITYYQKAYILQNLARVLSEKRDFTEAIRIAELGIQRAEEKGNLPRAEKIKNELRAYRQGMNFLSIITRKKPS